MKNKKGMFFTISALVLSGIFLLIFIASSSKTDNYEGYMEQKKIRIINEKANEMESYFVNGLKVEVRNVLNELSYAIGYEQSLSFNIGNQVSSAIGDGKFVLIKEYNYNSVINFESYIDKMEKELASKISYSKFNITNLTQVSYESASFDLQIKFNFTNINNDYFIEKEIFRNVEFSLIGINDPYVNYITHNNITRKYSGINLRESTSWDYDIFINELINEENYVYDLKGISFLSRFNFPNVKYPVSSLFYSSLPEFSYYNKDFPYLIRVLFYDTLSQPIPYSDCTKLFSIDGLSSNFLLDEQKARLFLGDDFTVYAQNNFRDDLFNTSGVC
jgi:hypothetical protein